MHWCLGSGEGGEAGLAVCKPALQMLRALLCVSCPPRVVKGCVAIWSDGAEILKGGGMTPVY